MTPEGATAGAAQEKKNENNNKQTNKQTNRILALIGLSKRFEQSAT